MEHIAYQAKAAVPLVVSAVHAVSVAPAVPVAPVVSAGAS